MPFQYWFILQVVFFVSVACSSDFDDDNNYIHFHSSYTKDSPYYIADAKVSKGSLTKHINYADLTCPPGTVYLANSTIPNIGLGAFAKRMIEVRSFFGPYGGIKIRKLEPHNNYPYAWNVYDPDDGHVIYVVDAIDPRNSNWLRYANCPVKDYQQNLIAVQYDGEIYYQAMRNIPEDEELFVYYGNSYAKTLNIDTKQSFRSLEILRTEKNVA